MRVPYPFEKPSGMIASNRASVAKFEDQKHGQDGLDDTFTREEKGLMSSASQPAIQSYTMPQYPTGDDDDNYEENLKLMYPEPGLRDTFVPGVVFDSHYRK